LAVDYKGLHIFIALPLQKKISENQYLRCFKKGSTVNLKDFKTDAGVVEGLLRFDDNFQLILEPKKTLAKAIPDELTCPKCQRNRFKRKWLMVAVIINQVDFKDI
jgi:hypothetical protein